jgi:hypothetical protein
MQFQCNNGAPWSDSMVAAVRSDGDPTWGAGLPDEPVFVDVLLITINIDIALFSYSFHLSWQYA